MHRDAVDHYRSSLAIFKEIGDNTRIVSSMNDLGNVLLRQDSLQEEKSCFTETIKFVEGDQLFPAIIEAMIGIATIRIQH